jgi:hypothetical protein
MPTVEVSPNGEMPEVCLFSSDYESSVLIDISAAADNEYLTPQQIADILKVSTDTVVRKFERRNGVLDLGSSESRFGRRYRVLRIPRTVFEAYVIEASVNANG